MDIDSLQFFVCTSGENDHAAVVGQIQWPHLDDVFRTASRAFDIVFGSVSLVDIAYGEDQSTGSESGNMTSSFPAQPRDAASNDHGLATKGSGRVREALIELIVEHS